MVDDIAVEQTALVFDIKRYAINDGPGIRVTVFLKGCPLSCRWCHNPESVSRKVQKMYSPGKCIGCGECVKICPLDACKLTPCGIETDSSLCVLCGACEQICPAKATEMSGHFRSVEELMEVIERERPFFDQSGGGVTFSGGEPLLHSAFLCEILDTCGAQGIHRTVDTSGMARTETLMTVAKRTDLFLYDLKLMDDSRHREWTGAGNRLILRNLERLSESGAEIRIRIPLIKGINDDDENIGSTAQFIAGLAGPKKPVNLLPYHNLSEGKLAKLGQPIPDHSMKAPEPEDLERVIGRFRVHGLTAVIGG